MPKARKKKTTEFDNAPVKSVFLYGNPNKGKLLCCGKWNVSMSNSLTSILKR